MNHDVFQQMAIEQSKKSSYKMQMGAVVVYRKNIVGKGFNIVHSTGASHCEGRHAEREALYRTTAKYRDGATVYVCRITKRGTLAMAKPCDACQTVMRKMNVKYVWYSHNNGWKRMRL